MLLIGIDLGTSAVKLLMMEESGVIRNLVSKEYPLEFPSPGWSQQNPSDWWNAVQQGILELLEGFDASQVRGIGAGGQMHGLVVLDENGDVIRPAILWNDGRTQKQVEYLNETIGRQQLSRCTANIAFAGFTAPKLLWMRENEPEQFARIHRIMCSSRRDIRTTERSRLPIAARRCSRYSNSSALPISPIISPKRCRIRRKIRLHNGLPIVFCSR